MGFFATKKELLVMIVGLVIAGKAEAVSSISSTKCPSKFIGTVTEVTKVEAPFTSLKKVKINLQVSKTLRGNSKDFASFQVIKNGPTNFEEGSSYEVEMRGKWLCSAKRV